MLDSGEDDDGTLFPFHVLTDAKLLNHPEHRSSSVVRSYTGVMSPADRQRPRPKSPNMTFTIKSDGEKEDGNSIKRSSFPQLVTQESQTLFHKKSKKADNGVDVFTSTSLVNLVKLMHPYCLKLHVEEGEKLSNDPTIFSKEVVLRYERPTEESDEEINVVSDDEEAVKEAKGKEVGDEKRDDSKVLKSVLVNGYSSTALPCRGKKRVRFGPVQVASFHESVEKALNKKNLTSDSMPDQLSSTKALRNPAGSACEHQTTMSSERSSDKGDALTAKGETKAKSLSLQQYRQLRQRRQPLVEKQGNYTTKWPSVPEPPKELSPILCLPGQRQNSCGPKTTPHCPKLTRFSPGHLHKFGNRTSCHYASLSPRPSPPETKPGKSGPKIPQTDGHMDKNQPVGSEKTSRLPPSLSVEPVDLLKLSQKTLRSLPELQTLDAVDIPEPMGTEIILSTQQEHPTSRKNPPSKAIQIIDPRPLPTKKTPISTTEPRTAHSSPHTFSSVSCDHDYCGPVDHSLTSVTQRSRAKLSLLKDVSEVSNEFQVTTLNLSAAAGLQTQTLHRKHSESSSCSSSPCHSISHSPPRHYRLPFSRSRCSRSRSRSWSQSRSRSPSPQICHRGWKSSYRLVDVWSLL
uniref:Peroxisome proliferator-activated receptor gamma coactivator-related protein 1-like n=1 Tax=Echeneis naucrates TaxID=173247 RepID=A0A665UYK7_ECHNA